MSRPIVPSNGDRSAIGGKMPDQSFSAENFQRIWDLRTRRGEDLSLYFPKIAAASDELRTANADLRTRLRLLKPEDAEFDAQAARYSILKDSAKLQRDQLVAANMAGVALEANRRIDTGNLNIVLLPGRTVGGKATYQLDQADAPSFFICRQLEINLRHAFDLKPPNRNLAAEQLFLALNDKTEKIVVRTDIRSFYESIPHDRLRDILRRSPGLSRTTCRFVDVLLNDYAAQSGSPRGLPRGIGLSAALAEVYLAQLDKDFLGMPDVLFYIRYVDDIVVIFGGSQHHPPMAERKQDVREKVAKTGLAMNARKTRYLSVSRENGETDKFSYLGYEFTIKEAVVSVDISAKREKRYRERISLAFENYRRVGGNGSAAQSLVDRIKFLSGNTRLSNNKRHALVGIYYSNSLLKSASPKIQRLDSHLARQCKLARLPLATQNRLLNLGFESGFTGRSFHTFSPRKMQQLVKIWKHHD